MPQECTGVLDESWVLERHYRGNYTKHEPGMCTDDSEMTAIVFKLLVQHDFTTSTLVRECIRWANSGTKSTGSNTRHLFKGYKIAGTYYTRFNRKFYSKSICEKAQSNGHLMRCSPLALIDCPRMREWSIEINVELTNPSSVSLQVEKIYINVLRECLTSGTGIAETRGRIRQNLEHIRDVSHEGPLKTALSDALAPVFQRDVARKCAGWSLHALSASLHFLLAELPDFQRAILAVVHRGGDTDTNGAIAGALLGALWGEQAMQENPATKLNMQVIRECQPTVTTRVRNGPLLTMARPQEYQWAHVEKLLETNLSASDSDTRRPRKRSRRSRICDDAV